MRVTNCQLPSTGTMHEDKPQPLPLSLRTRLVLLLTHHLDPRIKRYLKRSMKRFRNWQAHRGQPAGAMSNASAIPPNVPLKMGDWVRIRSMDEIRGTLDADRRLRGCRFMPEMEPYCGTIQRVYKPVERYLNEWDYTLRKAKGLVLLENLFCQGVTDSGRCDRSCFYFWRAEWLEKVEADDRHG